MRNMSSAHGWRVAAVAAVMICALASGGWAQQTNNYELRAVPAPGPVAIDGDLKDWDLSGQILMCYDLGSLLDNHSVRAAAMYDQDYFYVSLHFKDKTPMVNHSRPEDHAGGWKSDCVQIRMETDRVAHIDCWYYTDQAQPCLQIHYGMFDKEHDPDYADMFCNEVMAAGAKEAFRKDADGLGYVQEIALPWKLITRDGHPRKAGDSLRMGFECFWGDATGYRWPEMREVDLINEKKPQREFFWVAKDSWGLVSFLDHGHLPPSPSLQQLSDLQRLQALRYSTSGPVRLDYTLPQAGYVSLVVEKPDGTRVRNLIGNFPRAAGKHTDYWDGCDDNGRLVSPGSYQARGLYHGELDVRYQFNISNPGSPPWFSSDNRGKWLSDEATPMAALADADRVYLSAPYSEDGFTLIAVDYNGNKVWGNQGWENGGFLARAGSYLYVVHDQGGIRPDIQTDGKKTPQPVILWRLDAATGKTAPFPDGKPDHIIATWKPSEEAVARDWEGAWVAQHRHNADWCNIQAQGLAAVGPTVYVSLYFRDKILKVDGDTGQVIGEIPLHRPVGLASDGRRLYALSGTQVVEVNADSGLATPVVTAGLQAPVGLSLDAAGNLYVSDWADQMCVKVFSPQGQLLRTIGKPGGRPWIGKYDPTGMLLPRGISVDTRGRLWVAEDDWSPKRISCWNPDGTLALEKIGPAGYAASGLYNLPDQPDRFINGNNLMELNWKTGQWRVLSTLWRPMQPNQLLGLAGHNAIPCTIQRVLRYQGRTFIVALFNGRPGQVVVVSELVGDVAVPRAALGPCLGAMWRISYGSKGGMIPSPIFADHIYVDPQKNTDQHQRYPWLFSGPVAGEPGEYPYSQGADNNFVWVDTNGDGGVDPDEVRYYPAPAPPGVRCDTWGQYWSGNRVGDDLTLYLTSSAINPAPGAPRVYVWKLPVGGWTKSGAPIYNPDQAVLVVDNLRNNNSGDSAGLAALDSRGNLLTTYVPLTMFRPDGSTLWTYPNPWPGVHGSHSAPQMMNGRLIGPLECRGMVTLGNGVGEVFSLMGNLGSLYLMTTDGLYLAEMYRDCRSAPETLPDVPQRGMSVKNTSGGGEPFCGQFFRNPQDNLIYYRNAQGNMDQVLGLENTRRLPVQKLEFTAAQYTQAASLAEQRAAAAAASQTLQIAPLSAPATGVPAVQNFNWAPERSASWQFDDRHSAQATWTYDDKNLYLCFRDVVDDTPLINSGRDYRTLFKTGDAAVFELRTAAGKDDAGLLPGDLRLLFSVLDGKPVAVLYRYRVPGTTTPEQFGSGVGVTRVDEIKLLPDAQIAVDRQPNRYTLRAAVPLAELGLAPQVGQRYRGDFGIIYSDQIGRTDELRMYWSNPATGMVNDLSIEANIAPGAWGAFEMIAK